MSLGPVQPTSGGGAAQPVAPTGANPVPAATGAAGQGPLSAASPSSGAALTPGAGAMPAVLAALLAEALPTQDGLAPLLADLAAALGSGGGDTLPAAARLAAQRILEGQAPLGQTATAADVRSALQGSGILLEATLAAAARTAHAPAPDLTHDLKAQLLQLSAALDPAVEAQAAALAAPRPPPRRDPAHRPPPPARGAPTAGQAAAHPSAEVEAGGPEARARLRQEADAALARLQLSQVASTRAGAAPEEAEDTVWRFDLPLETPSGTAVAQMEIRREGRRAGGGHEAAPPVWRARFSADLEPSGPVHAEISLSGGRTRVTLWAERDGAFGDLTATQGELVRALAGPAGDDAAVRVLFGAPPPPVQTPGSGPVGHYLDRRS